MKRFVSANTVTKAGQERKAILKQEGQARQPDIIGKSSEGFELLYGELKAAHPSQEDSDTDRLRIAVFTKDSLDHMESALIYTPPIVSFQAVGSSVTIFLGAKVDNVVVHSKLASITLPTQLKGLELKEDFFFSLFQVRT